MSDLIQIETFIEVANSGSFAEASRNLAVPRSTVSARVKGLEKRLRTRLLNRNTRNVSLTFEGRGYLESCQQALAMLNQAESLMLEHQALSGKIRLSVPVAMCKRALAALIASYKLDHPGVSFEICVTDEKHNLVADNIDVAFRGRDVGDLDLIARKLTDRKLGFFASPELVNTLGENASRDCIMKALIFAPIAAQSRQRLMTQDFELGLHLACQGLGSVILPIKYCEHATKSGQLIQFNTLPEPAQLPVYLVYANRQFMVKRVRNFIDFVIENSKRFALT